MQRRQQRETTLYFAGSERKKLSVRQELIQSLTQLRPVLLVTLITLYNPTIPNPTSTFRAYLESEIVDAVAHTREPERDDGRVQHN